MQINYKLENEKLIKNMNKSFEDIYLYFEKIDFKTDDEYKRLNNTYYKLVAMHYGSFLIQLHYNKFSSAIVLSRTILEVSIKSFYCEFIEKAKNRKIKNILSQEYKFSEMLEQLDEYKDKSSAGFNGFFSQFSKKSLATYQQLSLFTHGKGEYLEAFYEHGSLSFTSKQIYEILNMMYKLFLNLSIFRLFVYGYFDEVKYLITKYEFDLRDEE
ncbi:hypothetical protein ACRCD7_05510 [Aliarcobacter sp. ERUVET-7]|uniref:hypothetical protein n=1 Tax=Aliarcobacter sp. ERUVET-7 TaxID=3429683 RepID=UPI003D6BF656